MKYIKKQGTEWTTTYRASKINTYRKRELYIKIYHRVSPIAGKAQQPHEACAVLIGNEIAPKRLGTKWVIITFDDASRVILSSL